MTGPDASGDEAGDAARDRLVALLDNAAAHSRGIRFWWRDDDAETPTPALDRLLVLARRYDLPLALAVVPKGADEALAERLADEPRVAVLQHGWQHRNHSPRDQKKMEFGDHRPIGEVTAELAEGFARLTELFPAQFVPVLVPPWNRIAPAVSAARQDIGLAGLSTFGGAPPDEPHQVNTHVDIIDWRARAPLSRAEAYGILCREVERRVEGDDEPLGVLTHHLVHQEASWELIDALFHLTAHHPAVAWPTAAELFDLPSPPALGATMPRGTEGR